MNKIFWGALLATLFASGLPAQTTSQFTSSEFGFTMAPPKVDQSIEQPVQVCIFSLPVSDGFSANVNVQIQPYPDSIASYDELSSSQFEQYNFTVLRRDLKQDSVVYEYTGTLQGRQLHWYALAKKSKSRVFLVTATALESSWKRQGALLKSSVDSFRFTN